MKRLVLLLTLACLLPTAALAQATAPNNEVIEYVPVVPAIPTSSGERIEVVEMFWYGCPHCYRLEPYIERWLEHKPDSVAYVRIPAIFNNRKVWELHARVYYVLELRGEVDRFHRLFFDAIHAQRRKMNTEDQVVAWFADQGFDAKKFRAELKSFAVQTKVNRAKLLTRRYNIDGVPSLIVEGKFRTGPSMAGTYARTMPTVDALVEKARRERETAQK